MALETFEILLPLGFASRSHSEGQGQRSARRCAHCGALAWYLCDAEVRTLQGVRSCRRAICGACRTVHGDRDLCAEHRATERAEPEPPALYELPIKPAA